MQAARDLVGIVVELAAGVQHGHDHFGGRTALFLVNVDRYAPAIVRDRHRTIGMNHDLDFRTMPGEGFID